MEKPGATIAVHNIGMDTCESVRRPLRCPGGATGIQGGGGTASSITADAHIVGMDRLTDADGQGSPRTGMLADDPLQCTASREQPEEKPIADGKTELLWVNEGKPTGTLR